MLGQPGNWLWMEGGCHLFNVFRDEIAGEEQVLYCTWCSREAITKRRPLELTSGNGEPGNIFESFCRLGGHPGMLF